MDGFLAIFLKAFVPWFSVLQLLPVMIFLERKGSALIADRVGPNRAFVPGLGLRLAGMVHNLSDVVKLLTKEEFVPNHANRRFYFAAPMLACFIALVLTAVIPFTPPMALRSGTFQFLTVDAGIGFLYILAISSLAVYSITLAGWASNNKYSMLGGLRGSAQMISYELAMGLAVVGMFMVYGTPRLDGMVAHQTGTAYGILPAWGILIQPIGFILFLIGGFAETNRNPFDMPEGESEIVGFHVEYGAIKFALFMMAEYIHIVVISLLIATCYFGGYELPYMSFGVDGFQSPDNYGTASTVLRVLLGVTVVGATLVGLRLLKWHGTNRTLWRDSRKNEGLVLAVLAGFGPAVTALVTLLLWGGELGATGVGVLAGVLGFFVLMTKTLFFCWLFVWVRWTTPRFRYDQLMGLGWKVLIPLGLVNIFVTGVLVKIGLW